MTRVLVTGSREWTNHATIREALLAVLRASEGHVEVAHGDCRGADRIADRIAFSLGVTCTPYPAKWRDGRGSYNPRAGLERNIAMLDHFQPDIVLAFIKDGSTGTAYTIREAKRRGIDTVVYSELS